MKYESIRKRQNVLLRWTLSLALTTAVVFLFLFSRESTLIRRESIESFAHGNPEDILYCIDAEEYSDDGFYTVKGWAIKPGIVYSFFNYGIDEQRERVYNNMHVGYTDGKTVYLIPTKLMQRDDVDAFLNDGIDYAYCGFIGKVPIEKVSQIDGKILVLIWQNPDGVRELYFL